MFTWGYGNDGQLANNENKGRYVHIHVCACVTVRQFIERFINCLTVISQRSYEPILDNVHVCCSAINHNAAAFQCMKMDLSIIMNLVHSKFNATIISVSEPSQLKLRYYWTSR